MRIKIFLLLLIFFYQINLFAVQGTSGDKSYHVTVRVVSATKIIAIPPESTIDDIYQLIRNNFNLPSDTKMSIHIGCKDLESYPDLSSALNIAGSISTVNVFIRLDVIQLQQQERENSGQKPFDFPPGYEELEDRAIEKLNNLKDSLAKLNQAADPNKRFELLQFLVMDAVALIDSYKLPPEARIFFAASLKELLKLSNEFFELDNIIPLAMDPNFEIVQNELRNFLTDWATFKQNSCSFVDFLRIRIAQEYLLSQIFWDYVEGARQQPAGKIYLSPIPENQIQIIKDYFINLWSNKNDSGEKALENGQHQFDRQRDEYITYHNDPKRYSVPNF